MQTLASEKFADEPTLWIHIELGKWKETQLQAKPWGIPRVGDGHILISQLISVEVKRKLSIYASMSLTQFAIETKVGVSDRRLGTI